MKCTYCGSQCHTTHNCPKTWHGSMNRRDMRCTYCGSQKHNLPACPHTWEGNAQRHWNPKQIENDFIKD